MAKKKCYVTFVPQFQKVGDTYARLTATKGEGKKYTDEFTPKQAKKVAEFLRRRGDKAIKIKCIGRK